MNQFRIELTTFSNSKVFWTVFLCSGDGWCNCGSGWEEDFPSAYESAYNYYLLYKKCNQ